MLDELWILGTFILEIHGSDVDGRYVSDRPFISFVSLGSNSAMTPRHDAFNFPFWAYLKQPVFSSQYTTKLNPWVFWRLHRLEYLERCWIKVYKPEEHYNP